MPEPHAFIDSGAALDCCGEVAAVRRAQAIATGEQRTLALEEKEQTQQFKFGRSTACDCPCQFDGHDWRQTELDRSVCLVSRRWLSRHRCWVSSDPSSLNLQSSRQMLHSLF